MSVLRSVISRPALARALGVGAVIVALGTLGAPLAQQAGTRVGYVVSTALLKAHPNGQQVATQTEAAQKELKPLEDQITALRAKTSTGTATAAERQKLETLTKTYQTRAKAWQDRLAQTVGPATEQIDAAIRATAKAQGYTIVFDGVVAQQSGLVIYADESVNLTTEVEKVVKK